MLYKGFVLEVLLNVFAMLIDTLWNLCETNASNILSFLIYCRILQTHHIQEQLICIQWSETTSLKCIMRQKLIRSTQEIQNQAVIR